MVELLRPRSKTELFTDLKMRQVSSGVGRSTRGRLSILIARGATGGRKTWGGGREVNRRAPLFCACLVPASSVP